jgi:NAD(P)-dependent dehydrogenase (short-subunit alcohol dehydrogenase family)
MLCLSCIKGNQIFRFHVEPQRFSKDGHEEHMQVNHLAPALLAMLLIPSLLRGSPSRIVNVNSIVSSVLSPTLL